jgi:RHS repeat-associated protein
MLPPPTTYDYEAFGQALHTGTVEAVRQAFAYTARRPDHEVGGMYYRLRQLAPHTGRFSSRDPIPYYGSPDGNRYGYVANRSPVAIDPYGLHPMPCQVCSFKTVEVKSEWKHETGAGLYGVDVAFGLAARLKVEKCDCCPDCSVGREVKISGAGRGYVEVGGMIGRRGSYGPLSYFIGVRFYVGMRGQAQVGFRFSTCDGQERGTIKAYFAGYAGAELGGRAALYGVTIGVVGGVRGMVRAALSADCTCSTCTWTGSADLQGRYYAKVSFWFASYTWGREITVPIASGYLGTTSSPFGEYCR